MDDDGGHGDHHGGHDGVAAELGGGSSTAYVLTTPENLLTTWRWHKRGGAKSLASGVQRQYHNCNQQKVTGCPARCVSERVRLRVRAIGRSIFDLVSNVCGCGLCEPGTM
jgi:hypothetical protein